MGYEDRLIREIDKKRSRVELSPLMKEAEAKAREVLGNSEYVIQESDFESIYGSGAVAEDVESANILESKFKSQSTPETHKMKSVADIFEAIVLMQSELNEWFGENVRTFKTARYDDYKNKVDMVAEWFTPADGSRLLALAVDVTFGTKSIQHKLQAIKEEIDNDKLGSIKYFKDDRGDFIGTRNNVPRTVIGVSESMVEELAGLWTQRKNKELGEHSVQRLFMDEIESQLIAMRDYAVRQGKSNVISAYEQALGTIRTVRADKEKFFSEKASEDFVAKEIMRHTEELFRP